MKTYKLNHMFVGTRTVSRRATGNLLEYFILQNKAKISIWVKNKVLAFPAGIDRF